MFRTNSYFSTFKTGKLNCVFPIHLLGGLFLKFSLVYRFICYMVYIYMLYISFNESPIFWLSLKHFAKTFILCFYGFQANFVKTAKAICICILVQKVWHLFFFHTMLFFYVTKRLLMEIYTCIYTCICIDCVLAHHAPGWHISYSYWAKPHDF